MPREGQRPFEDDAPAPGAIPSDGASYADRSDGCDLRALLEAYERSLILAALGAVGSRQRSAALRLRIQPSTLSEKMRRLGLGWQRLHEGRSAVGPEVAASLRWIGSIAPGATLELRGLNGPLRVEAANAGQRIDWIWWLPAAAAKVPQGSVSRALAVDQHRVVLVRTRSPRAPRVCAHHAGGSAAPTVRRPRPNRTKR